jgi:hypothetical protein
VTQRPHPARKARWAAGAIGSGGFLVMIATIADGSTVEIRVDVPTPSERDDATRSNGPVLDLTGGAQPGAGAGAVDSPSSTPMSAPPATSPPANPPTSQAPIDQATVSTETADTESSGS